MSTPKSPQPSQPPPANSSAPPEPSTFNHWSTAFSYPIPTVRKLEVQLRKQIDENNNKLRSLVGSSYRDLLGTAERIIEMDRQVDLAERYMGDVGGRCNVRIIERKLNNARGLRVQHEGHGRLAKVRVLGCVLDVVGMRLKRGRKEEGGEAIVAAKLLVLARLLFKSAGEGWGDEGEQSNMPMGLLEGLRKRMIGLRRRLLAYIDRVVGTGNVERKVLVDTLCAYAHVTSSGSTDVLKYFLRTRFERMQLDPAETSTSPDETDVLELLDLYGQTLMETRAVFPKMLAEAMARLQKVPLLQDAQIQQLGELNLDVYGRWIDDNIRNFTPWVRQDQLASGDVASALTSWAVQAQNRLLQTLKACMRGKKDAPTIIHIRGTLLHKFLPMLESSNRVREDSHINAFHDIRKVFLARIEEMAQETARGVALTLEPHSTTDESLDHNLWSLASETVDIKAGASQFRYEILQKRNGRDSAITFSHERLKEWLAKLDSLWETITSMRTAKWDTDDIDVELSDGDPLAEVLSKKDSEHLQTVIHEATTAALQEVYKKIESAAKDDQNHPARHLRLLRELDSHRRYLGDRINTDASYTPIGLISSLHERIAESVLKVTKQKDSDGSTSQSQFAVTLWDGNPGLPVQPTPATYKTLLRVQNAMSKVGSDIWTSDAVAMLKKGLDSQLSAQYKLADEVLSNGHDKQVPTEDGKGEGDPLQTRDRERCIQQLFDVLYLGRVMNGDELGQIASKLQTRLQLDPNAYNRLKKNAGEYWKRTYLLFGLLAIGA